MNNLIKLYETIVTESQSLPLYSVASLGLVSPGAATDGVALFFLEKIWQPFLVIALWKVMTFLAVVSSPLPSSHVVYPVFFPWMVSLGGGPPPPPSDAAGYFVSFELSEFLV